MLRSRYEPAGAGWPGGFSFRAVARGIIAGSLVLAAGAAGGALWFAAAGPREGFLSGFGTMLLLVSFLVGGFAAGAAASRRGAAHGAGVGVGLGALSVLVAVQLFPEAVSLKGALIRLAQAAVWAALGGLLAARAVGRRRHSRRAAFAFIDRWR